MVVTDRDIEELLIENRRRTDELYDNDYDPVTGYHCNDFGSRVKVEIPDLVFSEQWLPKECMDVLLWQNVIRAGSVERFIVDCMGKKPTDKLKQLVNMELCKVRFREDPEFAMYITDTIEDKKSGLMIPFKLNHAQKLLLGDYEEMRKRRVPILEVLLKARQWGGSTLTQLYMKWLQDYWHDGWNSIILAQSKDTSRKIKAMYKKAVEHQPGWTISYPGVQLQLGPFEGSQNDFQVTDGMRALRRSTISIASFENYDSVRGSNFHCAHYSEVAYWKETPEHDPNGVISSVSGGILPLADNMQVFESSGRGASGFFYDMCQKAQKEEAFAYKFRFVPFYQIDHDTIKVEDEEAFARWLLENKDRSTCPAGYMEEGKWFWYLWTLGACFDSINWYRQVRNTYTSHAYMATEAPADATEAFKNSGNLIFNRYSVEDLRRAYEKKPMYEAYIDLPQGGKKSRQMYRDAKMRRVQNGETGELKIWSEPNNNILKISNRYLVSVDIGGNSAGADYTVMTVIDRMGLLRGAQDKDGVNRPKVVARYRGHCRHDILAWKAAALAYYYDNALLVIESNTADRERDNNTEGDHFGTIIEEIADYYENLYQRSTTPDAVQDKVVMKFGFQTNKLTKGWVIDNMIAYVDDGLWVEPDEEMYKELFIYERRDDGSMGNIKGKNNHDDVLMSTAIGLWISQNEMEAPAYRSKTQASAKRKKKKVMTEAVI